MIKVRLIEHTPDPEKVIAIAAKLCYSPVGIDGIENNLTPESISKFIKMLSDMGHESPTEHVYFTFGIEGISRACSHQIVRHRIASYSQQSQRYVDGENFDFVVPPAIEQNPNAKELFIESVEQQFEDYARIRDSLIVGYIKKSNKRYTGKTSKEVIADFKSKNKKEFQQIVKLANEDARYILPNAATTKIICTFNVRSLQNFFKLRCCNRAQWEIRLVAEEMLKICKEIAPNIFANSGPECVRGGCKEGKMSCGKASEIKQKFKNI